jgi:hypothetical protein
MASYYDSAALVALAPPNAGKAKCTINLASSPCASCFLVYSAAVGPSAKDGSQAMPKTTLALLPFFLLLLPPASLFPTISILRTQLIHIENLKAASKKEQ